LRFTVKLGGSILEDEGIRSAILAQISNLAAGGHEVILVHGGGKSLSRRLSDLGLPSRFVEGLRVTDAATLDVAVMVLAGSVNKTIVTELGRLGSMALGICGADAQAVRCVRLSDFPGEPAGLGFVGKPCGINRKIFELLLQSGSIPVVSSLAVDDKFQLYNVNADQMASICAWGAGCQALVYLTDVAGVRLPDGSTAKTLGRSEIESLRRSGAIAGGMLPKTGSCLEALERGVGAVYIVPGASPDILTRFVGGTLEEGTHIHG
jgi:acetylglutamate kinase